MEKPKCKVDAMDGKPAVALAVWAVDLDIVKHDMLELLNGPGREHDPRQDRIYKKQERIRDSCGDTAKLIISQVVDLQRRRDSATHLFPHLPHALHTAVHVAAPQQLAPIDKIWSTM